MAEIKHLLGDLRRKEKDIMNYKRDNLKASSVKYTEEKNEEK
jgi:hypothetical protein